LSDFEKINIGEIAIYSVNLDRRRFMLKLKMSTKLSPFKPQRIALLAYTGCLASGVTGTMDVCRVANLLDAYDDLHRKPRFEIDLVSVTGGIIVASNGFSFQTIEASVKSLSGYDAVILPGLDHDPRADLTALLEGLSEEVRILRRLVSSNTSTFIVSTCSSTLLVAATGALDTRSATVSWWLAPFFKRYFPEVKLDTTELIVSDGRYVTSGGTASYIDLALWLVGTLTNERLKILTSRVLAVDCHRASQAPYIVQAFIQPIREPVIERAHRWLQKRLSEPITMDALANYCHLSQRTLLRRFQEAFALTPEQYIQRMRAERAKALLETTALSFEQITGRCGYVDTAAFRQVFKRWVGLSPKEYRQRFAIRINSDSSRS
jgi:transcriptional regulator GlxA family with amidase domain